MPLPYQWQWRIDKWKNAFRSFFGVGGTNQPRPKLCPACGALVGINATKCHECGTNLRFSLAAISKSLSGIFGEHESPVTTALLIANLLMFGVSFLATTAAGEGGGLSILWGMGSDAIYRLGASYPPAIFLANEYWRVVTAMFLHGGLLHIGFNMMALMQFGPMLEDVYGSARYLFVYVVTGVLGFLLSAVTVHFSLGASGALLGIMGAILAVTSKRGGAYIRELRSRMIGSLVILFAIGLWPGIRIDNWAHGGGLAAGFVLGKIFADRQPMNSKERQTAHALGWLAGIVVIASFVLMIIHYRDPTPWHP